MPFFDEEFDSSTDEEPAVQVEFAPPAALPPPQEDEAEDPDVIRDVDQRLEVASLYRMFLRSESIFPDDSPAARMVHRRFRTFARSELEQLFNLASAPAASSGAFTDQEVQALKVFAANLIRINDGKKQGLPAAKLQLHIPRVQPKTTKPVKVAAPTVRPVSTPAQASKAPPRPQTTTQEVEILQTGVAPIKGSTTGIVTRVVRRKGRTYREYLGPDGKVTSRQDLTPQLTSKAAIPTPSLEQMTAVTQMKAAETVIAAGLTPTLENKDE